MTEMIADRYRRVSRRFTERAEEVPDGAWEREVRSMLEGMEPYDDALRSSGQYDPKVQVPEDADDVTRLIAFTGRQP